MMTQEECAKRVKEYVEKEHESKHWAVQKSITSNRYQPCSVYIADFKPSWCYGNTYEECLDQMGIFAPTTLESLQKRFQLSWGFDFAKDKI